MLNRDSIRDGIVYKMLQQHQHLNDAVPRTAEERAASLNATLAEAPDGTLQDDVWVFGYGSLIWNPAFHYDEKRRGRIYGYHRAYCIWSHLGRGTPDNPGLMLALDRGGSCCGAAFRIAPDKLEEELSILWSREMAMNSYIPAWVTVHTEQGPVSGLTFTIDRNHTRYVGRLPPDIIAGHLATAEGYLGTSAEYLQNVVAGLAELGIRDAKLLDVHRRVTKLQVATSGV
ncbi:MAG: gamma-glutamylcyclotransferase [Alphaproteobacteria bacterium]|nr:gamma-glutamylcyclotransferase [Alphaproteobacteria bacterium]